MRAAATTPTLTAFTLALLTACARQPTVVFLPTPTPPPATVVIPAPVVAAKPVEALRAVPRGDWVLMWSATETVQGEALGVPTETVKPAPGARRLVVLRELAPGPVADPFAMNPFDDSDHHSILALTAPVSCKVGDVLAFTLEEGKQTAEIAQRGERVARVRWTSASAWQTVLILNGKMTQSEGVRSSVFVEALAPGTAAVEVRVGEQRKSLVFVVSR